MQRLLSFSLAVFIFACALIATARPAFGYVDPGSGFLAIQTLASVAAAFGYFLRRRIKALFTRKEAATSMPLVMQKGNQSSAK